MVARGNIIHVIYEPILGEVNESQNDKAVSRGHFHTKTHDVSQGGRSLPLFRRIGHVA